jgi:hypothetical protein
MGGPEVGWILRYDSRLLRLLVRWWATIILVMPQGNSPKCSISANGTLPGGAATEFCQIDLRSLAAGLRGWYSMCRNCIVLRSVWLVGAVRGLATYSLAMMMALLKRGYRSFGWYPRHWRWRRKRLLRIFYCHEPNTECVCGSSSHRRCLIISPVGVNSWGGVEVEVGRLFE